MVLRLIFAAYAIGTMWSLGALAAESVPLQDISGSPESTEALISLAARYEHAEGVERDYMKAIELYCQAARSGNAGALYSLGWMYANGRGVAKDDGVARLLIERAAEQGHSHASGLLRYINANPAAVMPSCLLPPAESPPADEEEAANTVFPKGPISELVTRLAPQYDVDPGLALAVISVESGFNVKAKSPKNAQGLMQLMPDTARRFGVKNPFDPEDNVKGGLEYLRWLLAYFRGNVALVAAAYNAGERAVESYRGIPPYPETRDYVRKITSLYQKAAHPYRSHITDPSPISLSVPLDIVNASTRSRKNMSN